MIAQFLGGTFGPITTPPVDAYGNALTLTPPTTVPAAASPASSATPAAGATTPTTVPANTIPSYDPRPC
jgi:hypothetical protein